MKVDIEMFLITKRKVIGGEKMRKRQREAATIIKWAWISCTPYITTILRNALFTDK